MRLTKLIAGTALAVSAFLASAAMPAQAVTATSTTKATAPAITTTTAQLGVMGPYEEYSECAIDAHRMEEQGYTVSPCDWSLGGWYFAYF
ncbi:hypothetical protein [Nonomuraea typhae]|uniref:Secreted protein n=1 Tax=Nonomuraea typhae TaxID=2603600 RepID=A0ABW7YRA1_9ACTN